MSLLVAYEDRYCLELDRTLRRVLRRDGDVTVPRERHSVMGVNNFPGLVQKDWPFFRDRGFPVGGKRRQSALLCVADADAVVEHFGIEARARPYHEWIERAEIEFTTRLRAQADQPEQVHGALLRWNYESAVIAGYDEPEAMLRLAGVEPVDQPRLDEFLLGCSPDPRNLEDDVFTDTFEGSQRCLAALAEQMGWHRLKKGDTRKDNALKWMTENRLDKLVRRVPDLERIAGKVRQIALAL